MTRAVARPVGRLITRRPGLVATVIIAITALSVWRVSKLEINHNQLELIPQNLPSVESTRRMVDLTGGIGYLMLALRSDDVDHMKAVGDDLADRLEALPEIRFVWYKLDVRFVRDRIAMFVGSDDLREGAKRVRKKIRRALNEANPFYIALSDAKPEPITFTDLVEKYRHVNKKRIDDPYYVDRNKEMLLLVIKPRGNSTDLKFARRVVQTVQDLISDYNVNNTQNAKLMEYYGGLAPGATVTYGLTGSYKTNLDDSETMSAALIPTSAIAFIGILLYLLLALRRPSQIAVIMTLLVMSVTVTFAFCELAVGELNTITAILGAILMGLGIDFGIHFMYRFREEYSRDRDLNTAIIHTLEHSGPASATSALTVAATLYILTLSDFRGFSDFGLVAGTGVLLTFVMMYVGVPTFYAGIDRVWPSFKERLLVENHQRREMLAHRPYPGSRGILALSVLLTMLLAYFALQVQFDYDSRSIATVNRPSILLAEDLLGRYQVSSDPVGYYTETLAETRALYDRLMPIPEGSTVDSVASVFTLVPDAEQQHDNRDILDGLKERLDAIDLSMLSEENRKLVEKNSHYLDAEPFTVADLPPHIARRFRPVPESPSQGYLTFVYPRITVYDGRQLIRFADEIGSVDIGTKTLHGGGMAVLYADLARIVLGDGKRFSILAACAIFLIILIGFRSFKAALFATLPLAAGMVWMLGLMALWGWRINFMNIVVLPVVFGYGISSGIHLYHRYLEGGSVFLAVSRTGAAVAASCITTLIGWAALLASEHRGLESMGILACFGIASALAVSLTVLPAVLQLFHGTMHAASPSDGPQGAPPDDGEQAQTTGDAPQGREHAQSESKQGQPATGSGTGTDP